MSEFHPEKLEKRTAHSEREESMSGVVEASVLLRQVAEPRPVGDTVKSAITRAARRVSKYRPMTPGRAEDIWRREAKTIRSEEMDAIRKAAKRDREMVEEARNALADIDVRIARLEALLVQDSDFHRDQVAAHLKALGRDDRSVD